MSQRQPKVWLDEENFNVWVRRLCGRVQRVAGQFPRMTDLEIGTLQVTPVQTKTKAARVPASIAPRAALPTPPLSGTRAGDASKEQPAKRRKLHATGHDFLADQKKRYPYLQDGGKKVLLKSLKTTFLPAAASTQLKPFKVSFAKRTVDSTDVVFEKTTKQTKKAAVTPEMRMEWREKFSAGGDLFSVSFPKGSVKSHILVVALPMVTTGFSLGVFNAIEKQEAKGVECIPDHVAVAVVTDMSADQLSRLWGENTVLAKLYHEGRLCIRRPGDINSKSAITNKVVVLVAGLVGSLPNGGGVTLLAPEEALLAGVTNTLSQKSISCRILQYPTPTDSPVETSAQNQAFLTRVRNRLANKLSRLYATE